MPPNAISCGCFDSNFLLIFSSVFIFSLVIIMLTSFPDLYNFFNRRVVLPHYGFRTNQAFSHKFIVKYLRQKG